MKRSFFFIVFLIPLCALGAQQITRFAVVDLAKVYSGFQTDSRALKEWEDKSAKVQAEVDKRTAEIQNLIGQKAQAELGNNDSQMKYLDDEITRKTEALKIYYEVETKKLEDQKNRLASSSDFVNSVYNELRIVAESEGYSMVLNLRENRSILWYSQAIDITDKVIANLKAKAGR
ncbi:MAG: OmpH family outer membrane protein [Spirochaetaceae bacterium]|jgi:outer membrane protein|nr:OmpH family outer membrane protein [Spirochaetaceae bacterium]